MEDGILIKGKEQQQRDTTWWTSIQKQKSDNYYWERYRKFINKEFSPDVVKTIDTDTDVIMDNIENPQVQSFFVMVWLLDMYSQVKRQIILH